MKTEYLFVYGSLRQSPEGVHPRLARYTRYLADGRMQGRLYEIGGYPGAVLTADPNEYVLGEVYEVLSPEALFRELDRYEECDAVFAYPHEYVRRTVKIDLQSSEVTAWVYLYNRNTTGLERIASGDYGGYCGKS